MDRRTENVDQHFHSTQIGIGFPINLGLNLKCLPHRLISTYRTSFIDVTILRPLSATIIVKNSRT